MSNYTTIKNVAQFLADPSGGLEMCRYADVQFPEPGEYAPQQLHITPASAPWLTRQILPKTVPAISQFMPTLSVVSMLPAGIVLVGILLASCHATVHVSMSRDALVAALVMSHLPIVPCWPVRMTSL